MDPNFSGSQAAIAPQGGSDSCGTPPGRSLASRFTDSTKPLDDGNRYRAPVPIPGPQLSVEEARTPAQIALFIAIVVGVVVAMIFA